MTFDQIIAGAGEFREFPGFRFKKSAPPIKCMDGTTLSVQAGSLLYSTPRTDEGPYAEVEVGFPSVRPPDSWAPYFDGDWEKDDPTESVYGYIPVELVRQFIESHGGEIDDGTAANQHS